MLNISEDKLKELITQAVNDGLDERIKRFWVDPKEHYLDHQLLGRVRTRIGKLWMTVCNTIVYAILGIILTILGLGFKSWLNK